MNNVIVIILLVIIIIFIFLLNIQKSENFSLLSDSYAEKKNLDRINLQKLINKSETSSCGCLNYYQPSNPCSLSYNTNFYS